MLSYTKKPHIRCMLLLVFFCLFVNIVLYYCNNLNLDFNKIQQQKTEKQFQQKEQHKEILQQQKQQLQEKKEEKLVREKQQSNYYDFYQSSKDSNDPVTQSMEAVKEEQGLINTQSIQRINDIKQYRENRFNSYSERNKLNQNMGLGDWGKEVSLNESLKEMAKKVRQKEMFNKVLSDLISLDRRLPDFRNPLCLNLNYPKSLPRASVILVFCDEAPSMVWRTVHSVVNRSPPSLLEEVILVDDASKRADLEDTLLTHAREVFPDGIVKVYRSDERIGLIKARNLGASKASGEVLVFLDAHCEVTIQWLEPLLNRIQEEPKAVVCPLIDLISTSSLSYHRNGDGVVGAFDWGLTFKWMGIPKEVAIRKKYVDPVSSPAMAGGLFGIRKDLFFYLGQYDDGMNIWGAENIEMSIRVWTCGSRIEILPCSRVGHLYRATFPYQTDGKDLSINSKRVVEVWMDEYKDIFYLYFPYLKQRKEGDTKARKDLRKKLNCKPFKWYLDAVFPQLFVPYEKVLEYGAICNPASSHCWDSLGSHTSYGSYGVYLKPFKKSVNQLFSLDMEGGIRKEDRCLVIANQKLQMEDCGDNKQVLVVYNKDDGRIRIKKRQSSGNFHRDFSNSQNFLCVEAVYRAQKNDFKLIFSEHCHSSNFFQYWKFEKIL